MSEPDYKDYETEEYREYHEQLKKEQEVFRKQLKEDREAYGKELQATTNRELDRLLVPLLYKYDREQGLEVREEHIWQVNMEGEAQQLRPLPEYTTSWTGIGEMMERLWSLDFNVELYYPAEPKKPCRAIVTNR